MTDIPVWSRRPGEPSRWYDRFFIYLGLGPERTIAGAYNRHRQRVAENEGRPKPPDRPKPPHLWYVRSLEWDWRERATAYDDEQRRLQLAVQEKARATMLKRHATAGQMLQGIGAMFLQRLGEKLEAAIKKAAESDEEPDLGLTPTEARMLLKVGIEVERQSLGLPEHLLAVANLSTPELYKLAEGIIGGLEDVGGDTGGASGAWFAAAQASGKEGAD